MLTDQELKALDDWRFKSRMPSRASAIRELLKRGLAAEGFLEANPGERSMDFGVTGNRSSDGVDKGGEPGNGVPEKE
jgi:hypothetical protein